MNKRKEIREKIFELLSDNIPSVNIFQSRYLPVSIKNLPAICFYIHEENHEKNIANSLYDNTAILSIEYYVTGFDEKEIKTTGTQAIDDLLDDICIEIENIFCKQWVTLEKLIYNMELSSTQKNIGTIDNFEELVGYVTMKFNVNYKVEIE